MRIGTSNAETKYLDKIYRQLETALNPKNYRPGRVGNVDPKYDQMRDVGFTQGLN